MSTRGSAQRKIGLSAEDLPEFLEIQEDSPEKKLLREIIMRALWDYLKLHGCEHYRSAIRFLVGDIRLEFGSLSWCLQQLGPNHQGMQERIFEFLRSKSPEISRKRASFYGANRKRFYNR